MLNISSKTNLIMFFPCGIRISTLLVLFQLQFSKKNRSIDPNQSGINMKLKLQECIPVDSFESFVDPTQHKLNKSEMVVLQL